ncbi:HNH endonuclease [Streptomyces cylindrosporus]|uniref:HNH endonuclease n=1 Tax=Streptomyces cylindrosporus TaxID=2927583 RepID=A0ABS9YPQ5_9ACTN|nr:HNH endonuclease [Streptomyces cylindrosporus]MCI3279120.1 HNH endonuclease [Streptomyces cylindrosporus]
MPATTAIAMRCVPAPDAWYQAAGRSRKRICNRADKRSALARRHGKKCTYCGAKFRNFHQDATLDHVIPNRLVKNIGLRNLVLACEPCNQAKGDQIPAAFMPLLAVLVYRLTKLNAAPVERSVVPVGGA